MERARSPFNGFGRYVGVLGVRVDTILHMVHWIGIASIVGVAEFVRIPGRLVGIVSAGSDRPRQFLPGHTFCG